MKNGLISGSSRSLVVTRWSARVLSGLILCVWGFFIVGHLVGHEGEPSRPLVVQDYLLLTAMGAWLAGLAVAWKWEIVGGVLSLSALLLGAIVNWRLLTFPFLLIAVAAGLFIISGWTSRRSRPRQPSAF
ncbi:MAG TPA: hypothetical protein VMM56_02160 [Planctomycetaceae bacterium]|nr:hypothetical protein [Planctomycetaceae bacterium]